PGRRASRRTPLPPAFHRLSLHDALPISWRDAYLALAGVLGLWALLLSAAKLPEPPREPPATPVRLRDALRDRTLVTWLFACTLRSEEHTSELQSHLNIVCRLLLEKKNQP